jgi:hypothetical protein
MLENLDKLVCGPFLSIRDLTIPNLHYPQYAVHPKCSVNREERARDQRSTGHDSSWYLACGGKRARTCDEVAPLGTWHIVLSASHAHASFHFSTVLLQL